MSMITRCRHCQTTFRITPEQLQAHGGQVRCGRCMQIFNGLAALVPEMQPDAGSTIVPPPMSVPPPAAEVAAEPDAAPKALVSSAETILGADAVVPPIPMAEPGAAMEPVAASQPATETVPQEDMRDSAVSPDNPFVHDPDAPANTGRRNSWLIAACVFLLLMLTAQGIYFYRGEIAARVPPTRQWLTAVCTQVGCTISLPQQPKAIVIEASDLQMLDPARPERIQLTATLRNHAGYDVAYPALDLVLTNANDHTLARRIFLPEEYLGAGRDQRAGFSANAELTVRLALETGNLGAAGFRLTLLAAPRL